MKTLLETVSALKIIHPFMGAAQRAAEMSRVRKLGVKRSKTKARALRQNE